MKITGFAEKKARLSAPAIDNAIQNIQIYLMDRYGSRESERDMDALLYYVYTGRASCEFLLALVNAKPYMIGGLLHQGGTVEETIERVKSYFAVSKRN